MNPKMTNAMKLMTEGGAEAVPSFAKAQLTAAL